MINIPIRKFNIQETDDFLFLSANIIKEGKNLNKTIFTLEGMSKCKDTFKEKPILCSITKNKSILAREKIRLGEGHNNDGIKYDEESEEFYESFVSEKSEKPVGFTPHDAEISIVDYEDGNWIYIDKIVIWKKYNYELCKALKNKRTVNKKVAISVEIEAVDTEIVDDFEVINEWKGLGITILALDDSVNPAITGASIVAYSLSPQYNKFKNALAFAYSGDGEYSITVKKDKKYLSDDEWNSDGIDKKVANAKNSNSVVNDIFLFVPEGWQEAPSKLKYPVMQIDRDYNAFYNRKALASARSYATKYKEKSVIAKLKKIYKDLDLEWDAVSSVNLTIKPKGGNVIVMRKFSNVPEEYTYIGSNDKIALFSSKDSVYSYLLSEDKEDEEFSIDFLVPMSVTCKMEDSEIEMAEVFCGFVTEKCEEVTTKCAEVSETEKKMEELSEGKKMSDEKLESYEAEKAEYEIKIKEMEDAKAEYAKKLEEAEEKIDGYKEMEKKLEEEKMATLSKEIMSIVDTEKCNMSEDSKKEITEACTNKKYSTLEEAKKEIAYAIYVFETEKRNDKGLRYNILNKKREEKVDIFSAAKNAVKKL